MKSALLLTFLLVAAILGGFWWHGGMVAESNRALFESQRKLLKSATKYQLDELERILEEKLKRSQGELLGPEQEKGESVEAYKKRSLEFFERRSKWQAEYFDRAFQL